jgi:predicted DNA-binding protein with PD1-like motif
MTTGALGRVVVVSLEENSSLTEEIKKTADENSVDGAVVAAIGTLKHAKLGFYHGSHRGYETKEFEGHTELVSCTGSLAKSENGDRVLHLHASISDEKFAVYAGHLFEAIVGYTAELYLLEVAGAQLTKIFNQQNGLLTFKQEKNIQTMDEFMTESNS